MRLFQRAGLRFVAALLVLWLASWFVLTGGVQRSTQAVQMAFVETSANLGFTLENIYVEGRENADSELLMALINADKGMPLFAVNPHHVHERLSDISWLDSLRVKRVLPDSLSIALVEREPVALWVEGDQMSVIDATGYKITTQNLERFNALLIVHGRGAEQNVMNLLSYVRGFPALYEKLDQAYYVGERRWDLRLENKITISLPENNVDLALQRLVEAHEQHEILDKKIKNIDIRQSDRLIIEAYPGATTQSYSLISGKARPI